MNVDGKFEGPKKYVKIKGYQWVILGCEICFWIGIIHLID